MDAQKVFGFKAFRLALALFLLVVGLLFLSLHSSGVIAFMQPFIPYVLPPWSAFAFAVGFFFLISFYLFGRERKFEVLKYEFVNIVTHKFRTPLTYITWSVENLKKNQSDTERFESVRQIENAASRLTELTDILIDMARIDEGYAYVFKAESMRELVEHVIAQYGPRIQEKEIKFSIDVAKELPLISVDVKRLEFVIRILLENALLYTPKKGLIEIAVYRYKDESIRFAIRDSGIGIKRSDRSHLFTKFFRSREATGADTEGMGLGLYIAHNIIKRHGGSIWAESEGLNKGSTFKFDLPLTHGK